MKGTMSCPWKSPRRSWPPTMTFRTSLLRTLRSRTKKPLFAYEVGGSSQQALKFELEKRNASVWSLGFVEGCDLGTVQGTKKVQQIMTEQQAKWMICYVPHGPTREGLQDDMSSKAWKRFNKVIRHLLELARLQIEQGGEVLWCQPASSSARYLVSVRTFWYHHQDYMDGRVLRCGGWCFRSTSSNLLRGLPSQAQHFDRLWFRISEVMLEVQRNHETFSLIGAVDTSVLDDLDAKELSDLMDRVHKIHTRVGHPSNRLLVKNLQARGADIRLLAAASQLKCDACLENRPKMSRPPVDASRSDRLWTDVQVDLFHVRLGERVYNFILFVDECSGYSVIRLVSEHPETKSVNATSAQVCHLLEEAWTQYFGFPERLKLDAEGALRGNLLRDWCAERGVELLHAPAEHHEYISEVERTIGTLRRKIETFLKQRPEHPIQAAPAMVTAHNSLSRTHGFSPLQWALGRDFSPGGHLTEGPGFVPSLMSASVPGTKMHAIQSLRVEAGKAFLEGRHHDMALRADRSRAGTYHHFLPGDLVFYRRYKTPADLPANTLTDRARLSISRWYGPARILATETKGEAGERRPSSHVWIIAQGSLKKCHYCQLRHATRTEQLVAAEAQGVTFPWTMTSLTSLLEKGAYEDLTRAESHFPEDLEVDGPTESGPPLAQGTELSDEEMIPADPELRKRVAPEVNEDEEMIQDPEGDVDLERLLNDPTYDPLHPLPDLSQSRQSFLQQRARHEQDDRPWHVRHGDASFYASVESSSKIYAITIDAPADAQGWKKMVKNPEKFATKAMAKGVEISWSRLTDVQRKAMAEAKGLEIGQWVEHQVCRKFAEKVPDHQLLRMRWVLTFKEAPPADDGRPQLKAKA